MSEEHSRWARFRDRHRDHKQRRAWRRERRRTKRVDAYDAANVAESKLHRGGFFSKQ